MNHLSILVVAVVSLLVCSCTAQKSRTRSFSPAYSVNSTNAQKIVYTSNYHITVENIDSANAHLLAIVKASDGYVQQSGSKHSIIRVKQEKFEAAQESVSSLGKITSKSTFGRDETASYTDYEMQLKNALHARKRYLSLLEKAENVQAALLVEKELERLNGTIDILKGKMKSIDHLSEYATLHFHWKEKQKPGILGYIGIGIYEAFKWLVVRN